MVPGPAAASLALGVPCGKVLLQQGRVHALRCNALHCCTQVDTTLHSLAEYLDVLGQVRRAGSAAMMDHC